MKNSKQLNAIALDSEKSKDLIFKLNDLLANYQVFYTNVRGYHWNIKGDNFFELHVKFEELYNDLQLKIDEIAERILTLGFTPYHSFSNYLENSEVPEAQNVTDGKAALKNNLESFEIILGLQREILELSERRSFQHQPHDIGLAAPDLRFRVPDRLDVEILGHARNMPFQSSRAKGWFCWTTWARRSVATWV